MSSERTLDDAMQDFLDEYGSQFLSLEGPDMEGNWHAEIMASGTENAKGVHRTPAGAIDAAMVIALAQEPKEPRQTPDTGERSE